MAHAVSIVTPAYNDVTTLVPVIRQLQKLLGRSGRTYEIVIVDDESHDGTVELLKKYSRNRKNLRVFYHKDNLGIAETYRELYQRARYQIIVLFSLDGEWEPVDVLRLIEKLERDTLDMVVGWRQKKAYRCGRKLVSMVYNYVTRLLFGVSTYDAGSIKAMRKELLDTIPIVSVGVFDEAERIIRASRAGYRIGFLPVSHNSVSHKRLFSPKFRLIGQAVVDMVRVWRSSLSSR